MTGIPGGEKSKNEVTPSADEEELPTLPLQPQQLRVESSDVSPPIVVTAPMDHSSDG